MRLFLIFSTALLITACASDAKDSAWFPLEGFKTDTPFPQAIATCEYDLQMAKGPTARLSLGLLGMQHPLFESCMAKFGYKWEKRHD